MTTEAVNYNKFRNQTEIFNAETYWDKNILIVWAWGIGSTLAVVLAKMGIQNITVVDFDIVELHNTSSQFFRQQDIDKAKVVALQEIVKEQADVDITIIEDVITEEILQSQDWDVIIPCVDNNDVRKDIVDWSTNTPIIVDVRMSWTWFEICSFSSLEKGVYFDTFWYPQSEVQTTVCWVKAVAFNCFAAVGMTGAVIRKRLMGEEVPFRTAFDLWNFYFETWEE